MSRWTILRQANLKYDEWASMGKRDEITALEALELYREFHSRATDPFTRAFCAAFEASMNPSTTTPVQRAQLVDANGYSDQVHTQSFFDFLALAARTTKEGWPA